MTETRKLAAILVADVVGYSRLAGADEDRTLSRLRGLRSDLIDPAIAAHHARIVKRTGDGSIIEFRSVVDAVRCAIEVQTGMVERNAGLPLERRIEFRVGIHLGDVVEEADGDLMGDGVKKPQYERRYGDKKDANHPATFDEFWQDILPELLGRTWIILTQRTIDDNFVGEHFNKLVWRVLNFKSSYTFLTGDRPIIMTNGMAEKDSHLAILIGPRKLFIGAHTTQWADALIRDKADDVIAFVNDRIVRQARRFCIGVNDAHLSFFAKRFGEMLPSSPVETAMLPTAEELTELALADRARHRENETGY
jgi:hypothetical protein